MFVRTEEFFTQTDINPSVLEEMKNMQWPALETLLNNVMRDMYKISKKNREYYFINAIIKIRNQFEFILFPTFLFFLFALLINFHYSTVNIKYIIS